MGGRDFYRERPERRERQFYGFVEAIYRPAEVDGYARMNLVLDAVDMPGFDGGEAQSRSAEYLSIIRILTTPKRLFQLFGLDNSLDEAKWLKVVLAPTPGQPPAWILNSTNDYTGPPIRTNVVSLELIPDADTSADASGTTLEHDLRAWCTINTDKLTVTRIETSQTFPKRLHIRVLDVGHASCAAIHSERQADSKILGYYDVGGPVFFHHHTLPKQFAFHESCRVPSKGFVALSHWDFDHYSLAVTHLKELKKLHWYAPDQLVGPNAAKLQENLGKRLRFINSARIPIIHGLGLHRGKGPVDDRNNSGYLLRLRQQAESVLLAGDVGYEHVDSALMNGLTALGITHHGGNGSAVPPVGVGKAVVSYGLPNRYHHPNEDHLKAHTVAGWTVKRTAGDSTYFRGDRWLTRP